jgi:dTMP kinase
MKGKLIVIEGTDGSGKGTQTALLAEALKKQGKTVHTVEFPQYGTPGAAMVEQYLNGKLGTAEEVGPYRASLLYAMDRYSKLQDLTTWLENGDIIICNRYVTANMGHQAGKLPQHERDAFLQWVDNLEYELIGLPRPDAVLLLIMPYKIATKLVEDKGHREYIGGQKKDIHEADQSHLQKAEEAFRYVAEKEKWHIVNCNDNDEPRTREAINKDIVNLVEEII